MTIRESFVWEGRTVMLEWLPAPFEPPRDQITQASGVCFTADDRLVLVAGHMGRWALPGGHVEPGETIEQTLKREVVEEACAVVRRSVYLGAQKVSDPHNPGGPREYYQARLWARVALRPFKPKFERTQRALVAPTEFVSALQWPTTAIAQALLDAALAAERRFKAHAKCH